MATLTKTWNFTSDAEGFVLTNITRIATGELETKVVGRNTSITGKATLSNVSYADLGVPNNSVVNSAQLKASHICSGYNVSDACLWSGQFNGNTVIPVIEYTGTTSYVLESGSVSNLSGATAADTFSIEIDTTADNGNDKNAISAIRFDYVELVVDYTETLSIGNTFRSLFAQCAAATQTAKALFDQSAYAKNTLKALYEQRISVFNSSKVPFIQYIATNNTLKAIFNQQEGGTIKQSVAATIDGQEYTLTYNAVSGKYEASINAPESPSGEQTGGYYSITVEAIDVAHNSVSEDGTTNADCRLIVNEYVSNLSKALFDQYTHTEQTMKSIYAQAIFVTATVKALNAQAVYAGQTLKALFDQLDAASVFKGLKGIYDQSAYMEQTLKGLFDQRVFISAFYKSPFDQRVYLDQTYKALFDQFAYLMGAVKFPFDQKNFSEQTLKGLFDQRVFASGGFEALYNQAAFVDNTLKGLHDQLNSLSLTLKSLYGQAVWAEQTLKSLYAQPGCVKGILKSLHDQDIYVDALLKAIYTLHGWTAQDEPSSIWTAQDEPEGSWTGQDEPTTPWN